MSYIKERVSYLKGLAEGMKVDESTDEGKLLMAIIDVMDDIALAVEDIEEIQDEISEQVDDISNDVTDLESVVFDVNDDEEYEDEDEDEDEDENDDESDSFYKEIKCPYCNKNVNIDLDDIDEDGDTVECPNCHKDIEIEWECDCGSDECEEDVHK